MAKFEPTKYIWSDGKLVGWEEATVHVLSHALHYGTSYFEGIRAYQCSNGTSAVFRLKEHMQRLVNSGKIVGISCPYSIDELCNACVELLKANKMPDAYIRPLSFVGYGSVGILPQADAIKTIIAAWSWGAYLGPEALEMGVRAKTSSFARLHPNTHMGKSKAGGNYLNSVLAKQEAVQDGYDEAIMLDTQGFVSEATGANIFIVRDKVIKTTPLTSVLEGITRNSIIEIAKDLGYAVIETPFTRDEVYCADEVFFSGTAAELTPVREYDNRVIGEGKAGEVTKTLQNYFFEVVKGNNPKYQHWLTPYTV